MAQYYCIRYGPRLMMSKIVSVVIPAYNSETTLGETLKSVRDQTYQNLDIIVIDDGSTDGTAEIARIHAAEDPRIRVLSISNSGVATARNVGIAASRGEFVAPVDADDLWHPDKIARQVAVMEEHGPEMGYVYTLYRRINTEGQVLHSGAAGDFQGHVYLRGLLVNFVGNGSALLARRAALDAVGGYEPDLHRQGAQGCEDYLIQLLMARSWTVGLVREYLTGYRLTPEAMSSDWARMLRSHLLVLGHVSRHFPETPADILAAAEAAVRVQISMQMLRERKVLSAGAELWRSVRLSPVRALEMAAVEFCGIVRRRILHQSAPMKPAPDFWRCHPLFDREPFPKGPLGRRLENLAGREAAFFQVAGNRQAGSPSRGCEGGLTGPIGSVDISS